MTLRHLRRHPRRRAHARLELHGLRGLGLDRRDPHVAELDAQVPVVEHVVALQVAVRHAPAVQEGHAVDHVAGDGELALVVPLALEQRAPRLAVEQLREAADHELGDDAEARGLRAGGVEGDQVRVPQVLQQEDLLVEGGDRLRLLRLLARAERFTLLSLS